MNKDIIGISRDINAKERRIRVWPRDVEVLHTTCEPVTEYDDQLHQEIADMFLTLENNEDGIALAANQVGIFKRMFIANIPMSIMEDSPYSPTAPSEYSPTTVSLVCINPKIVVAHPNDYYKYDEGCLSIPGYYETTIRPRKILLQYNDTRGREFQTEYQGLIAFAIQHEMEHLDGKLFIDGKSKLKLDGIRRKLKKRR